jgi:hypothetical protein
VATGKSKKEVTSNSVLKILKGLGLESDQVELGLPEQPVEGEVLDEAQLTPAQLEDLKRRRRNLNV